MTPERAAAPISFRPLAEAGQERLVRLMSDPRVYRYMPLSSGSFTPADCDGFLAAKAKLWADHGYGPWALFLGEDFAGWGGFQWEDGDADLGLVLAPDFWGAGQRLAIAMLDKGFGEMGFPSVTALLPPGRPHVGALLRAGFVADSETTINDKRFLRFRLHAEAWKARRERERQTAANGQSQA